MSIMHMDNHILIIYSTFEMEKEISTLTGKAVFGTLIQIYFVMLEEVADGMNFTVTN